MTKGRFLNQKLGKRTTRKVALLKSRIQTQLDRRVRDSGANKVASFPRKRESIDRQTA